MSINKSEKRRYWRNRVTCWYLSGLSLTVFCQKHALERAKMKYWFYRLNLPRPVRRLKPDRGNADESGRPIMEVHFVPVTISDLECTLEKHPSSLDLVLDRNHRIRIYPGFDPQALTQLIQVLQEKLC